MNERTKKLVKFLAYKIPQLKQLLAQTKKGTGRYGTLTDEIENLKTAFELATGEIYKEVQL